MPDFSTVEDTLFVPMLGRIYASENFPEILLDEKALELKSKLPQNIKGQDTQTQYTLLASAVRSQNMDRYIRKFMKENESGIIVQIGCGLETTYYRNLNEKFTWYEIDLPDVIAYRRELLGEKENEKCLAEDAFKEDWIKNIREEHPNDPILVTSSGVFYYFEKDVVINLLKTLKKYGNIEVVFDTVNSKGMKQMGKYMKQVGHSDALMYFYVDDVEDIKKEIGAVEAMEEPYYAYTKKKGLKFMTSISMKVSDKFKMVKMEYLKLN